MISYMRAINHSNISWFIIVLISRDRVTIDGIWIGNWITNHCHIDWSPQPVIVSISRCFVAAFNYECSPSFGFPNYPWSELPHSYSSSSQLQNRSVFSLNHQLTSHFLTDYKSQSQSQDYVTIDGKSASLSVSPHLGRKTRFLLLSVAGLLVWGALFDEKTCLSFTIASGTR
jgi:hypothetical protein